MTSAPVIVELRGRLGNQLFQFAAGYALCLRLGCELLFSGRALGPAPLELPRVIGDLYREACPRELLRVGALDYEFRGRRFAQRAVDFVTRVRSRAAGHAYVADSLTSIHVFDPEVLEARPPCLLRGYFQSECYFSDHASEVGRAFQLAPFANELLGNLARPIVGVSFRRGDYNSLGWALPLEYYEAALSTLCARAQPGTLLVMSDDRDFSKLVEPWLGRFAPVVNALQLSDDPVAHLAVFAGCDHAVIANSTFSWWGAWLAEHRAPTASKPIVVAPADWQRGRPTPDVIPERWAVVSW